MFSFFSRKNSDPFPFDRLVTDMHSHLLPGIDDGSKDADMSENLVRGLLDLGYSKFITTPHVMASLYPNKRTTIESACNELNRVFSVRGLQVPLRAAAEYMLDEGIDELLDRKEPLLTLHGNLVLVEVSFASPPLHLKEILFNLQINGYQPVLAHPERYAFYHHSPRQLVELKEAGCLFQANLLSFSGYYGASVRDSAQFLAKKNLIDLLGTDLHHERHLDQLRKLTLTPELGKLINEDVLLNKRL